MNQDKWLIGRLFHIDGNTFRRNPSDIDFTPQELPWIPDQHQTIDLDILFRTGKRYLFDFERIDQRAGYSFDFDMATACLYDLSRDPLQRPFLACQPDESSQHKQRDQQPDQKTTSHQKVNPSEKCKRKLPVLSP